MSNVIDEKVVSMRFDNRHFESNVSTTMSTLDKLKQKLNFGGAAKGLDDVSAAAKRVDVSNIGRGVESVGLKFNAMYTIADQAFRNITNSAMACGKNIINALTIDPVKTGLNEFETKMNAIQVIQSNTRGKNTMEDITDALADLNDYADKTIYNFAQMTSNVGKFTAQGFDVQKASNAVKGLANLAAASGASAEDMARATYQMSQALGGNIKLMDWNSLRNANMATQQLKDTLIALAKTHGIAIDDMIAKEGTFEYTLQSGWLTGEMFTEAMNIYSGVYSEAELAAKGFSESQIKNFMDLAKNAESAATEVKTFTQLWDVLKETAQSGWTQTWEAVFGDFDQAKKLFTDLQNYFSNIINAMSDARNFIVNGVLNFTKPWQTILDKLMKADLAGILGMSSEVKSAADSLSYFQEVVDKVWNGDFNNQGDNPDRRDLLTAAGYDKDVVQYLVNLGEEAHEAGKSYTLTVEDIEAAHKKFGKTMTTSKEETEGMVFVLNNLSDARLKEAGLTEDEIALYRAMQKEADRLGISIGELADKMSETSGRSLLLDSFKNIWKSISEFAKIIKDAWVTIFDPPTSGEIIVSLYGLLESFRRFTEQLSLTDEKTGKLNETGDKFRRTIEGIFAALDIVLKLVGGPIKLVFKMITGLLKALDIPILDVTASLGDMLVAFNNWLDEALDFEAIFRRLIGWFKSAPEAIRGWISSFKESAIFKTLAPYMEVIAKHFRKLIDSIKETAAFKKIASFISPAIDSIKAWIEGLKEAENIPKYIIDSIVNGFKNAFKSLSNIGGGIGKIFSKIFGSIKFSPEDLDKAFTGIGKAFGKLKSWVGGIDTSGLVKAFDTIKGLFGGASDWLSGLKEAENIPKYIFQGLVNGLKTGIKGLWGIVSGIGQTILDAICGILGIHSPSTAFYSIAMFCIAGLVMGIDDGTGIVWDTIKTFGTKILTFIKEMNIGDLISAAFSAGSLITMYKFADALQGFSEPFAKLGDVFEGVERVLNSFAGTLKAFSLSLKAEALKDVAIALAILAGSLVVLTYFYEPKMWAAVGVVGALAIILVGLAWAMKRLGTASASFKKGEGLKIQGVMNSVLQIGAAILLIAIAAKLIAGIEPEKTKQAFLGLAGILGGILVVILAFGVLSKKGDTKDIEGFAKMLSKIGFALLILAVVAKIAGSLSYENFLHLGILMGLLGTFIYGITYIETKFGKQVSAVGKTLMGVSTALLILAIVAKIAGTITLEQFINLAGLMGIFGLFVAGLCWISSKWETEIVKVGGTLLALSVAIGILALTVKLLSGITWDAMGQGLVGVGVLAVIMYALIQVVQDAGPNAPKMAVTLIAMAGAIAILAGISVLLGFIGLKNIWQGLVAVGALSGLMMGLIAVTKNVDAKTLGVMITLAGIIALLGGITIALSCLDIAGVITGTAGMAALLGMTTLMMYMTKTVKKEALGVMVVLAVIIGLFGAILITLSNMPVGGAIAGAAALSVLMGVMVGVLFALGAFDGGKIGNAMTAMQGLLLLSGVAMLLAIALGAMGGVNNAVGSAVALSVLMGAMTGVLYILGTMSTTIEKAKTGVAGLLILSVMLVIFATALYAMSFVKNAVASAVSLSLLLGVMVGVLYLLGTMDTSKAIASVAAMIVLSASLLVLATALNMLGGMTWSQLAISLIALAGAMVIIGVAAKLLTGSEITLLAIGAAFVLLGVAVMAAGVGLQLIASGIAALAAVFSGGAAQVIAAGVTTIVTSLIALIPVIVAGIGAGIMTLCQVIIQAAPLIAAAIGALVANLTTTLIALVPLFMQLVMTMLTALLEGLTAMIPTVVTFVVTLVTQLLAALTVIVPQLIQFVTMIITELLNSIIQLTPLIVETAVTIVSAFLDGLTILIPKVVDAGMQIIAGVLKGIADNIDDIAYQAVRIIAEFINGIAKGLPLIIQAGFNLIISFINGLADAIEGNTQPLIDAVNRLMDAVVNAIKAWFKNVVSRGSDLVGKLGEGIKNAVGKVKEAVGKIWTTISEKISSWWSKLKDAGKNVIDGFVQGIKDKVAAVGDAATDLGKKALNSIKSFLGIKSPSREFIKIGKFVDMGLVRGLKDYSNRVVSAAKDVGGATLNPIQKAIANVSSMLDSDMDMQPTIRPVLDLSDVRAGAGAIGGMFDARASVGVVGSISSTMNRNLQNGSNEDVVSEIKKLRHDIGNLSSSQYNINGITYDDGTNMSEAIKSIVRAARIERRV